MTEIGYLDSSPSGSADIKTTSVFAGKVVRKDLLGA